MLGNTLMEFPPVRDDEDYRSIVYRYHIRSTNDLIKQTMEELFNIKTELTSVLPKNLNVLFSKLSKDYPLTIEDFLFNHTWYGLVRAFNPFEKIAYIQEETNYANYHLGQNNRVIGRSLSGLLSEEIRYCPECMQSDFIRYGECYIHRSHQVAFINICTEHNCGLISNCLICDIPLSGSNYQSISPYCVNGHQIKKSEHNYENSKIQMLVVELIVELNLNRSSLDLESIKTKFINHLGSRGYLSFQDSVLQKEKLINDFFNHFGETELKKVGISQDDFNKSKSNQISYDIVSKKGPFTVFYLLLMCFLANGINEFIQGGVYWSVRLPFGHGPWQCFNKNCEFNNETTINKFIQKVSTYSSKISGEFICPECGYTYSRSWRPNDCDQVSKKVATVSFGPVTIIKLLEYCLQNKSIAQLGEIMAPLSAKKYLQCMFGNNNYMQCNRTQIESKINELQVLVLNIKNHISDGTYLTKFKEIIGNGKNNNTKNNNTKNKDLTLRLIESRAKILGLIQQLGNVPRSHIESKAIIEYRWLLRYDREWMESNLPSPKNKIMLKARTLNYINLDTEYSEIIRVAARALYERNPYKKIKKYSIINTLNKLDIRRISEYLTKGKLPKCVQVLKEYEETDEAYLLRKIPSIVKQLLKNGSRSISFKTLCGQTTCNKLLKSCSSDLKIKIELTIEEVMRKELANIKQ